MIIPFVAAEPKLLFACTFGPDKINHEANRDILVYRGSYYHLWYTYIRRISPGQPVITIEKSNRKNCMISILTRAFALSRTWVISAIVLNGQKYSFTFRFRTSRQLDSPYSLNNTQSKCTACCVPTSEKLPFEGNHSLVEHSISQGKRNKKCFISV